MPPFIIIAIDVYKEPCRRYFAERRFFFDVSLLIIFHALWFSIFRLRAMRAYFDYAARADAFSPWCRFRCLRWLADDIADYAISSSSTMPLMIFSMFIVDISPFRLMLIRRYHAALMLLLLFILLCCWWCRWLLLCWHFDAFFLSRFDAISLPMPCWHTPFSLFSSPYTLIISSSFIIFRFSFIFTIIILHFLSPLFSLLIFDACLKMLFITFAIIGDVFCFHCHWCWHIYATPLIIDYAIVICLRHYFHYYELFISFSMPFHFRSWLITIISTFSR